MSDTYLILIPEKQGYTPPDALHSRVLTLFKSQIPKAEEIELVVTKEIRFIDCGENLEAIRCPSCAAPLDREWWLEAMDRAAERDFSDIAITSPCCARQTSLGDLKYDWPQGFARFSLEAMNPDIEEFPAVEQSKLEMILGCPLRQIWSHI